MEQGNGLRGEYFEETVKVAERVARRFRLQVATLARPGQRREISNYPGQTTVVSPNSRYIEISGKGADDLSEFWEAVRAEEKRQNAPSLKQRIAQALIGLGTRLR